MTIFAKPASEIWRDYITDGVPASGNWKPNKADIRQWMAVVEENIGGAFNGDITQARIGGLWTDEPSFKPHTVTISIASPAVISWTGHGRLAGQVVTFDTTGALPTGITAGTKYYVLATSLTANTFQISLTDGGAAVNTSGSQSGTHSAYIQGVNIARFERVLIGAAADNDGTKLGGGEWLEAYDQFVTGSSELAVVAQSGRSAFVAAVRSSDNNEAGDNAIAGSFYAVNDNTDFLQTAFGIYVETFRPVGGGSIHCIEVDATEFGTANVVDPYSSSFAGTSSGLWVASGGGNEVGTTDASVALHILNNGAKWKNGIVFDADGLTVDGGAGTSSAIAMSLDQRIDWFSAASTKGISAWASAKGVLNIGSTDLSTEIFDLELGAGRTGDGACIIDLHAASGNDFEARVLRGSGANGNLSITNTGTGQIQLDADNAAGLIQFLVDTTETARVSSAAINLASGKVLQVNGTQVVSAQGAAVADVAGTADLTYGANEVTMINSLQAQLNALLARLRAHGLIAT